MGSELVSVMRSDQKVKDTASQALELSLHKEYSLTQRPNVQVERTVWIHRSRES